MSYPYSAAIFDLDGTLLDTLDDLAAATNATLTAYGFPVRTREEVRLFVGNGVEKLMERALPDGHATVAHLPDGSSADFGALLADFKSRYAACCEDRTRPYPGIPALLAALRDAGIPVAVVSNKFDAAVKALSAAYFGEADQEYTWAQPIPEDTFDGFNVSLIAPLDEGNPVPSCRNADGPYHQGQYVLTVDGFLVSDNVTVTSSDVVDLGFAYSDHNPVEMRFVLEK